MLNYRQGAANQTEDVIRQIGKSSELGYRISQIGKKIINAEPLTAIELSEFVILKLEESNSDNEKLYISREELSSSISDIDMLITDIRSSNFSEHFKSSLLSLTSESLVKLRDLYNSRSDINTDHLRSVIIGQFINGNADFVSELINFRIILEKFLKIIPDSFLFEYFFNEDSSNEIDSEEEVYADENIELDNIDSESLDIGQEVKKHRQAGFSTIQFVYFLSHVKNNASQDAEKVQDLYDFMSKFRKGVVDFALQRDKNYDLELLNEILDKKTEFNTRLSNTKTNICAGLKKLKSMVDISMDDSLAKCIGVIEARLNNEDSTKGEKMALRKFLNNYLIPYSNIVDPSKTRMGFFYASFGLIDEDPIKYLENGQKRFVVDPNGSGLTSVQRINREES